MKKEEKKTEEKKTEEKKTEQTIAGRKRMPGGDFWAKDEGIDGILVTVGLCIIALLLCVVMKDSLSTFITTLVSSMTSKATTILNGTVSSGVILP